jgi:hypothetical protein
MECGGLRRFGHGRRGEDGDTQQDQITAGASFQLRFTPLRPIELQESALLDLTLRLTDEYGVIGGRTVYEPSDVPAFRRRATRPSRAAGRTHE